jgi:hypothetical protein
MNGQDLSITIPIASEFRTQAEQIAAGRDQVYWKTIALLAVTEYLQWQGYEVRSDFIDRALTDDVWIAGVGRIGCFQVSGGERFELTEEMQQGRIGSIMLSCEEKQVRLWGFLPLFDPEDLPTEVEWSEVQSLDVMVEYFARVERGSLEPQVQELEPDEVERLMLVAMLERIYREEQPNRWGIRAAAVLGEEGRELVGTREAKLPKDLTERQGLAERMMKRLAEVWGNE